MNGLDRIENDVIACARCPELRAYCAEVAREKRRAYRGETYWGKPVPAFGDPNARVMLVGLAPGAHGSNRTGRMFTGDASGDFLFPTLYRAGFASQPHARGTDDGMALHDCIITAAGRCAPPKNKPTPQQLRNCLHHLLAEFDAMPQIEVAIGLGKIGFDSFVSLLSRRDFTFDRTPKFGHGARYIASREQRCIALIGSYHPSRQNTNTGKLTVTMFDAIFTQAKAMLKG